MEGKTLNSQTSPDESKELTLMTQRKRIRANLRSARCSPKHTKAPRTFYQEILYLIAPSGVGWYTSDVACLDRASLSKNAGRSYSKTPTAYFQTTTFEVDELLLSSSSCTLAKRWECCDWVNLFQSPSFLRAFSVFLNTITSSPSTLTSFPLATKRSTANRNPALTVWPQLGKLTRLTLHNTSEATHTSISATSFLL